VSFSIPAAALVELVSVTGGCVTVPTLELECFHSLAADYLAAQEERLALDATSQTASHLPAAWLQKPLAAEPQSASEQRSDALVRLRTTRFWYERLSERLRLRAEEEDILSEVRLLLFMGPTALLYPIVQWNLHQVLWNDEDPDAATDPIARYCTERLSTGSGPLQVESLSNSD
jgi:hypothetical protein